MKRIVPALFILAGIAAYTFSGVMSVLYGHSAALTQYGQLLMPAVMILFSVFTFSSTCAAGSALKEGRRKAAFWLFSLALLVTSYTAWNVVGYMTTENIGKVRLVEARAKQETAVAEIQNKELLDSRKGMEQWLKSTFVNKSVASGDRKEVLEKLTEITQAPVPLKKIDIEAVAIDARNEVMGEILSVDQKTAAKISNGFAAALLVLIEMLGPSIGAYLYKQPSRLTDPAGNGGNSTKNDQLDVQQNDGLSFEEAIADLRSFFPRRTHEVTASYLKERWRCKKPTVHYRLNQMQERGMIELSKEGNRLVVVSVKPYLVSKASA